MRDYPSIIGLSGYAQAGKNTLAAILHDMYGYKEAAFADTLRESLYRLNPYITPNHRYAELIDRDGYETTKKIPEVRRLLQVMGTEVGRQLFGEDVWVDATLNEIGAWDRVVITDVRFPNEYEAVVRMGGQVWRIERPGVGAVNRHPSETSLDGYDFAHVIQNDGSVRDLAQKVLHAMDGLQAVYQ